MNGVLPKVVMRFFLPTPPEFRLRNIRVFRPSIFSLDSTNTEIMYVVICLYTYNTYVSCQL